MLNNDERYVNESETRPFNDTFPEERPSERLIQTYRTLSADQKDEYVRLYIEMCYKGSHVTLDQHAEAFKKIGVSLKRQHPTSNFKQDKKLCTEVADQKTKEFEFKVPTDHHKTAREPNVEEKENVATDEGKKENLTNSRMTRRRCTTYFRR